MSIKIQENLGSLPKPWNRSVIFFANILSLFFGNEKETDVLKEEIGALESYGSRLIPLINLLFDGPDNLLVLEREPEGELIHYFKEGLGLSLPRIKVVKHELFLAAQKEQQENDANATRLIKELSYHKARWIDGYVTDEGFEKLAGKINKKTISTSRGSHRGNNKLLLYEFLKGQSLPVFDTFVAVSPEEATEYLKELERRGYETAAIKSQIGASGIGMLKINFKTELPPIPPYLFYEGPCLVQGWLDETVHGVRYIGSPSVQMFIKDNEVCLYDITDQILSADSVHEGNVAPPPYFQEDGQVKVEALRQAQIIGKWLCQQEYRGTASVDFHVVERNRDIVVYACEINARVTGATYPSILARHFLPHSVWLMRNIRFSPPLEGEKILEGLKQKEILFYPGREKGVLPFNFNPNREGLVMKGQFLLMGSTIRNVYSVLETMSRIDLLKGDFDRD